MLHCLKLKRVQALLWKKLLRRVLYKYLFFHDDVIILSNCMLRFFSSKSDCTVAVNWLQISNNLRPFRILMGLLNALGGARTTQVLQLRPPSPSPNHHHQTPAFKSKGERITMKHFREGKQTFLHTILLLLFIINF